MPTPSPPSHPPSSTYTRVVKLGGSLLDLPHMVSVVERWISCQSPGFHVVIVGGGALVDVLRELQPRLKLRDAQAHWLAVRAMSLAAHVVQAAAVADHRDWPLVEAVDNPVSGRIVLLDVAPMLRQTTENPLPADWTVTSDSIAAWVAIRLNADELVLLKSQLSEIEPPYVDPHFNTLAHRLRRCRVVNLRSGRWEERAVR